MKAQDLRIGNYVTNPQNKDLIKVTAKMFEVTNMYRPIPLTEEWLLKFGFEKYSHEIYKSRKWSLKESAFVSDWFYIKNEKSSPQKKKMFQGFRFGKKLSSLEHVHQLQNLYFALTGEELTIKEL